MRIRLTSSPLVRHPADAWLVFAFKDEPLVPADDDALARRLRRMLRDWCAEHDFQGKLNETSVLASWESLPTRVVVLAGLGARKDFHLVRLWQATASAARALGRHRIRSLAVSLKPVGAPPPPGLESDPRTVGEILAAALIYGRYTFTRFYSQPSDRRRPPPPDLIFTDAPRRFVSLQRELSAAVAAAHALAEARDLANLPANEATPEALARAARRLARKYGLSCRVLDRTALARRGCRAFLAVGQGSRHEPRLIILRYPGRQRNLKPVVLIGKTITFDTGGISLKTGKGMEWMKYDKCGGMAVLAALLMAARRRLRQPVIGLLAAAENMPGGEATRPGDIVRSCSGKTIEIVNTDAEGRLVLADTLTLAAEYQPAAIVDLATLTGASIVALGHVVSAVMGNDGNLVEQLRRAGEACGERLWPLPLWPDYDEDLKSPFADLKNVGEKGAGTIIGGAFLRQFVPAGVPWAHVDIANTAWEETPKPYRPAGATMFGAQLLVQWLRQL